MIFRSPSSRGGAPKLCQNICLLNIYCYQKQKNGTLDYAIQKLDYWRFIWVGSLESAVPLNYVKIFVSKISNDIKKTGTLG